MNVKVVVALGGGDIKISNIEHRTPNVEMKLECLNVEVVVELSIFTQPGGKVFSLRGSENAQPGSFGKNA